MTMHKKYFRKYDVHTYMRMYTCILYEHKQMYAWVFIVLTYKFQKIWTKNDGRSIQTCGRCGVSGPPEEEE